MTLWAQYLLEREGFHTLETDHGFATWKVFDQVVYLRDIYVVPEMRKHGFAKDLADEVARQAKELGCTSMTGTVDSRAKGATDSLKVLLAYGMKLKQGGEVMIFEKEI